MGLLYPRDYYRSPYDERNWSMKWRVFWAKLCFRVYGKGLRAREKKMKFPTHLPAAHHSERSLTFRDAWIAGEKKRKASAIRVEARALREMIKDYKQHYEKQKQK